MPLTTKQLRPLSVRCPGGVGSVGYVEVAGHEGLFDLGLDCLLEVKGIGVAVNLHPSR